MTILAHIASGYSVYKIATNTVGIESSLLLHLAIVGALAPDVDGFFGRQMKDHRNTVFHSPLFWVVGFIGGHSINYILNNTNFTPYLNIFFWGIFIHLFLDWFGGRTAGIRIFFPFSKKIYALFPIKPERGDFPVLPPSKEHIRFFRFFYFENKLLVISELLVILSPLIF